MLITFSKFAWRNFSKNRISSAINVAGLSIGMGVALLNGLWLWDEWSFNKYFDNYDRIGQLAARQTREKEKSINTTISYPLARELRTNYSHNFKRVVRSSWPTTYILANGLKPISATGLFMDKEGPDMLSLHMIQGTRGALGDQSAILVAASIAKALFGNEDAIGKTIQMNNEHPYQIAGVFEDMPLNTYFTKCKYIASFESWEAQNPWVTQAANEWNNHFIKLYVEIPENKSYAQVNAAIKDIEKNHRAEFKKGSFNFEEDHIYPMSQWHLYPYNRGSVDQSPSRMVRLVGIIGGIVLLLACINFMNLSTARSERRAREVGIRKAIGSERGTLISQFFSESLLVTVFAFLLSIGLVLCSLPWFNKLCGKQMTIPWTSAGFWLISIAFIFITGILAGSYPALYLSSFKPVKVLKGPIRMGRFAALPRKVLVVTQFTVSVILIICTIIVYRQIRYAKDRPTGYLQDRLITIAMRSPDFYGKYQRLRQELIATGAVTNMSESMGTVTQLWSNNDGFSWKGMDPNLQQSFGTLAVTSDHGSTIGWQFVQGRDFDAGNIADSSGIVMNEAAVRYMGLKDPVGEPVSWRFYNTNEVASYKILGVIKDMVMESPYEVIKPTLYFIRSLNGGVNTINVRIKAGIGMQSALAKIEAVFKQNIPAAPFEYKFVDEVYAEKFASEERIGKLAAFFGTLAVLISCLGIFGLSAFVAERRTREIGVRKVLGATVFDVWQLLSTEFVNLVFLSCLIAVPVAWYLMRSWINSFVYRATIDWWIFAVAAVGALGITLFTVSFQSVKAALKNPSVSLKTE